MKRRLERITVPAAAMAEDMDESPSAHVAATLGGSEEEEVDQRMDDEGVLNVEPIIVENPPFKDPRGPPSRYNQY